MSFKKCDISTPEFCEFYDELPLWSASFGLFLLEHVPFRPSMRILDVGAGTGFQQQVHLIQISDLKR